MIVFLLHSIIKNKTYDDDDVDNDRVGDDSHFIDVYILLGVNIIPTFLYSILVQNVG